MYNTFPLRNVGFALLLILIGVTFVSCSGTGFQVQQIPANGFEHTLHYQFQATVRSDSDGECKTITVRVKALNKLYTRGGPPPRLQLFDDNCMSPIRFERIQYITRDSGDPVRLSGMEINYFWSDHYRLENELMGWLWREGIM